MTSPTGTDTLKNIPNAVITRPRMSSGANNMSADANGTLNSAELPMASPNNVRATQKTGMTVIAMRLRPVRMSDMVIQRDNGKRLE
jgi:hypothetical protein